MQHARQRIREITARKRLQLGAQDVVQDLNRFRGRLGGLLPLRKLGPVVRQDQPARDQPAVDLRR